MSDLIIARLEQAAASCEFMALPNNAQTCRDAIVKIERLQAKVDALEKAARDAVTMSQPDRSTSSNERWIPKWVLHNLNKLLSDKALEGEWK